MAFFFNNNNNDSSSSNNNNNNNGIHNNNCGDNNNNNNCDKNSDNNQNNFGIMYFGILVIFLFNLILPTKKIILFVIYIFLSIILLDKCYSFSILFFNFHLSCIFLFGPYSLDFLFFFLNIFIKVLLVFFISLFNPSL